MKMMMSLRAILLFSLTISFGITAAWTAEEPNTDAAHDDDQTQNIECVSSFGETLAMYGDPPIFALSGKTLYLGLGFTVRAIDLADPAHPRELGWFRVGGKIKSLAVHEPALYIGTNAMTQALKIVDISDPRNLRLRGTLPVETTTGATVHAMGDYLLDTVGKNFWEYTVYLLKNPFAPVEFDSGSLKYSRDGFVTDGKRYFKTRKASRKPGQADDQVRIALYDSACGDTTVSTQLFSHYSTEETEAAYRNWLLESVDRYTSGAMSINNPKGPKWIWTFGGELNFAENKARMGGGRSAEDRLDVQGTDEGLAILDVSKPGHPVRLGLYRTLPPLNAVKFAGAKAYATDTTGGLHLLDRTDPLHLKWEGSYLAPCPITAFAIEDDLAFVNCKEDRYPPPERHELQVLDLARPEAVTRRSSVSLPYEVSGIASEPGRLYLATENSGLQIMDTTNPTSLTQAGSYVGCVSYEDLATSGSLVYTVAVKKVQVKDSRGWPETQVTDEVNVIDAAKPAAPVLRGQASIIFEPGEYAGGATVKLVIKRLGPFLFVTRCHYIGGTDSSFYVVDVSDPARPRLIQKVDEQGQGKSFAAPLAPSHFPGWYLALPVSTHNSQRNTAGVMIYDVSDPSHPDCIGCYGRMHATSHVSLGQGVITAADDRGGLVMLRPIGPVAPKR